MFTPTKNRITTNVTTAAVTETRYVAQIVITCSDAGATWTLKIQDKASSPYVIVPVFTLAVLPDGYPNLIANFQQPIRMDDGIDIVTASGAPPGVVSVWISFGEPGT